MGYKFSLILCCFAFSQMLSGQNMPVPYLNEAIDPEGRSHTGGQILTTDDGYVIADISFCNYVDYSGCINITKLDFNGQVVWQKHISSSINLALFSFFLDNNNHFILVSVETVIGGGQNTNGTYRLPKIFKLNSIGETVWERAYNINSFKNDYLIDGVQLDNGDYIFVGRRVMNNVIFNEEEPISIIRTDSLGEPIWQRTYYHSDYPIGEAREVNIDYDGNLIIAGGAIKCDSTHLDNGLIRRDCITHPILFKVTPEGDSLWLHKWGTDVFHYSAVRNVIPIPPEDGGGYIFEYLTPRDTTIYEET